MWDEFCGHFSKLECPMYNWEIFPPSQNDYVVNPESLGECLLLKRSICLCLNIRSRKSSKSWCSKTISVQICKKKKTVIECYNSEGGRFKPQWSLTLKKPEKEWKICRARVLLLHWKLYLEKVGSRKFVLQKDNFQSCQNYSHNCL